VRQRGQPNQCFKRAHSLAQQGNEQGFLGNSTPGSVCIPEGLRMAHSAFLGSARLNRGSEHAHSRAHQGAEGCFWRNLTPGSVCIPEGLRRAHSAPGGIARLNRGAERAHSRAQQGNFDPITREATR
jgi:hypothetical protein